MSDEMNGAVAALPEEQAPEQAARPPYLQTPGGLQMMDPTMDRNMILARLGESQMRFEMTQVALDEAVRVQQHLGEQLAERDALIEQLQAKPRRSS